MYSGTRYQNNKVGAYVKYTTKHITSTLNEKKQTKHTD